MSPMFVTSALKVITPSPLLKVCDTIEALNAFVCKPLSLALVVSANFPLAVYQISLFGIFTGMFLKVFQYSLSWYIAIVPSGTYRSQVE